MVFNSFHLDNVANINVPHRTFVEYFAGIGLVRLGLEQAGWRVIYANDIDPAKYEMYRGAYGDTPYYSVSDVFTLDPQSIPSATLATCSFPCIDLSLAGNQNGLGGKHSSAFWGFVEILRQQADQSPPIVLLENVSGWLHSNEGQDFRLTIQALNRLGYACDVFELDALRFTPQSRPRVFVIGTKLLKPQQTLTGLLERSTSIMPKHLLKAVRANPDLDWVDMSIPEPPSLRRSGLTSEIIERLADEDSRWWSKEEAARHLDMMAPSHRQRVDELAKAPRIVYRTVFRRMRQGSQRAEVRHTDTAGCLRTGRGGSSRQILLEAGNDRVRMRHMTPREYARLQGVPDSYQIAVPDVQAWTGFGDAVCVPALAWIGANILNPLLSGQSEERTHEAAPSTTKFVQYPLFDEV